MNPSGPMTRHVVASLVIVLLGAIPLRAEGLLYQLPEDGSWVKFDLVGKADEPDGAETVLTGTLTMSCVGTVDVDGQKCRWIELAADAKEKGAAFTDIEKVLIPEKYLVKGEDPLTHVLKSWHKDSKFADGAARERLDAKDPDSPGGKQIRGPKLRRFLHGPFDSPKSLDKISVDSKLGPRECEGISAEETVAVGGDLQGALSKSRYEIRLHRDAPFGVVKLESRVTLEQNGKRLGRMLMTATLSDFGKDAKSAIPEAK